MKDSQTPYPQLGSSIEEFSFTAQTAGMSSDLVTEHAHVNIMLGHRRKNATALVEIGITNQASLVKAASYVMGKYDDPVKDLKSKAFSEQGCFDVPH
ncbi:hypothetical protein BBBOND_0405270 [Babesia bigemina]|uniref:Uncharacterized protein n=1 Tax=Babesia bigemina TaxID=5866 RepID=A0A061DBU3_BABBI|nr:hypothetical protein BBBOND_0405270 [Babesia bigemina]CDR98043.1 hypothetical protein BBBOND_0405270 [Babesia bigemina]|eukprot:XP_012770229.1 hypothetical protein BBBOND_0405270 [Babesia bigemina]